METRNSTGGVELRSFPIQIREMMPGSGEDMKKCLAGHAAVFGVRTELYPGLTEEIEPGAFDDTLANDTAYMCWNHNPDIVLAGTRNGSLKLGVDETGLAFDSTLCDTTAAADAHELVRSGVVSQMSFGFIIQRQEWDESDPSVTHRIIKQVRLLEISPVLFPAYDSTDVAARAQTELAEYRSRRQNLPKEPAPPAKPEPRNDLAVEAARIRKKILLDKIDKEA